MYLFTLAQVIRANEVDDNGNMDAITIDTNSNIQDGFVIHSKSGGRVEINEYNSIAHRSIVHGPCKVGSRVLIGFNSVRFNCVVGEGSVVRHNSVMESCTVPRGFNIPSTFNIHSNEELATIGHVTPEETGFSESVAQANKELVVGYKRTRNEL